jgi:hypothetical protein
MGASRVDSSGRAGLVACLVQIARRWLLSFPRRRESSVFHALAGQSHWARLRGNDGGELNALAHAAGFMPGGAHPLVTPGMAV